MRLPVVESREQLLRSAFIQEIRRIRKEVDSAKWIIRNMPYFAPSVTAENHHSFRHRSRIRSSCIRTEYVTTPFDAAKQKQQQTIIINSTSATAPTDGNVSLSSNTKPRCFNMPVVDWYGGLQGFFRDSSGMLWNIQIRRSCWLKLAPKHLRNPQSILERIWQTSRTACIPQVTDQAGILEGF